MRIVARNQTNALILIISAGIYGCGHEQGETTTHHSQMMGGQKSNELLKKWCADCHAPPLPESHAPSEWPNVVIRMQQHRQSKGLSAIPGQDMNDIINYLQTHAQP